MEFTIINSKIFDGEFPVKKLKELGFDIKVKDLDIFEQSITIGFPKEAKQEDPMQIAYALGRLVSSYRNAK